MNSKNPLDKYTISYIRATDAVYPLSCTHIPRAPRGLFFCGNIAVLSRPVLGVVGPRKMSFYAERIVQDLIAKLPLYDICTISGGADGVDILVHTLSLHYEVPTIIVLAGGIHWYRKTGKRDLLEKILASGGLIVSEYPGEQSPRVYTFPQRNRIVAGLSQVLFLPEAPEKSGALITMNIARAIHIPIYAPMQDIYSPYATGTNNAIVQGRIKPLPTVDFFLPRHFSKNLFPPPEMSFSSSSPISPQSRDDTIHAMQQQLFG